MVVTLCSVIAEYIAMFYSSKLTIVPMQTTE